MRWSEEHYFEGIYVAFTSKYLVILSVTLESNHPLLLNKPFYCSVVKCTLDKTHM